MVDFSVLGLVIVLDPPPFVAMVVVVVVTVFLFSVDVISTSLVFLLSTGT